MPYTLLVYSGINNGPWAWGLEVRSSMNNGLYGGVGIAWKYAIRSMVYLQGPSICRVYGLKPEPLMHDYWTSTRRLRSRIYLPSLYFWDCSYALSYMLCENQEVNRKGHLYVFPTKGSAAFAAVNISDGVVACRHWAVIRLAFDNIHPVEIICKLNDRALRQWMTYTPSNRYARPCCPLKACR